MERCDLKISDLEFESTWVEIKNDKRKNIIIGCIYRHPHHNNLNDFFQYMTTTLNRLNKENKGIYICGDFNIDLLKYDNNLKSQEFYNLMSSNGFIPHITLPTRITDTSMSIIDNIYSNTLSQNTLSGNILIEIADHLIQFLSVHKTKIEYKNFDLYKRNFTHFNEDSFKHDISIQQWHNNLNDVNSK